MKKRVVDGFAAQGVNAQINFSISDGAAGVLAAHSMKEKLAAEITGLVKIAKDALGDTSSHGSVWRRYQRFDDIVDDTGFVCWRDPDRDRGSHDLDGRGIEFCTAVMVRPLVATTPAPTHRSPTEPRSMAQPVARPMVPCPMASRPSEQLAMAPASLAIHGVTVTYHKLASTDRS